MARTRENEPGEQPSSPKSLGTDPANAITQTPIEIKQRSEHSDNQSAPKVSNLAPCLPKVTTGSAPRARRGALGVDSNL